MIAFAEYAAQTQPTRQTWDHVLGLVKAMPSFQLEPALGVSGELSIHFGLVYILNWMLCDSRARLCPVRSTRLCPRNGVACHRSKRFRGARFDVVPRQRIPKGHSHRNRNRRRCVIADSAFESTDLTVDAFLQVIASLAIYCQRSTVSEELSQPHRSFGRLATPLRRHPVLLRMR